MHSRIASAWRGGTVDRTIGARLNLKLDYLALGKKSNTSQMTVLAKFTLQLFASPESSASYLASQLGKTSPSKLFCTTQYLIIFAFRVFGVNLMGDRKTKKKVPTPHHRPNTLGGGHR